MVVLNKSFCSIIFFNKYLRNFGGFTTFLFLLFPCIPLDHYYYSLWRSAASNIESEILWSWYFARKLESSWAKSDWHCRYALKGTFSSISQVNLTSQACRYCLLGRRAILRNEGHFTVKQRKACFGSTQPVDGTATCRVALLAPCPAFRPSS